jgi:hypothetical protein
VRRARLEGIARAGRAPESSDASASLSLVLVLAESSPKLTDWLTAVGGVGAFLATALLAVVAVVQMRKLDSQARSQAASTGDQIAAMREQVDVLRETSAAERAVVDRQVEASVEQGRSIRDAARAELQPVVFAHALPVKLGPDDDYSIHDDEIAFAYFIANEGTGIALNIRHGVEIDGHDFEFGQGMQTRVLRPGESLPIRDATTGGLIWRTALSVVRRRNQMIDGWERRGRNYWASFENVFGERFETRNPTSPNIPAIFRKLDG